MLYYGASTNVMSLKVMKQLGLWKTFPYGNVCVIDSIKVKVYDLIEDVEVYLQDFPHIDLTMNIILIDVPNDLGMLLSRIWSYTLWGFLSMDLTHVHIFMVDETFEILYSQNVVKNHGVDPNGPNYCSDCEYDVAP
jgi:hypothetical protein